MSKFIGLNPAPWATNPTYPTGSFPWSGQPVRVQPSGGVAAAGFVPAQQAPAELLNYQFGAAGDALALGAQTQVHAALQNWRQASILGGPTPVNYTELVGVLPVRSYDTNGDRQRMPVALGANSSDSNRTYKSSSCDGSMWSTYGEITITGGGHLTNVNVSAAGEPGVIVVGQVSTPVFAYSTDHGTNWTSTNLNSFGAGTVLGLHFAPGVPRYFAGHSSGVFASATIGALSSATVTTVPTPSSSAVTATEFADDGSTNIVLAASCAAASNAALYLSTNGGTSWAKIQDLPATTGTANVKYSKARGLFIAWDKNSVWTSQTGAVWTQTAGSVAATSDMLSGAGTFAVAGYAIAKLWRNTTVSSLLWNWGIAYSLDLGATWNTWGIGNPANLSGPTLLRSFNNRLYLLDAHTGSLWVSGQVGFAESES